jgi:DNA polymerase-1
MHTLDLLRTPKEVIPLLRGPLSAASLDVETSGLRPYHDSIVVLTLALWREQQLHVAVLHWPGGTRTLPAELCRALEEARVAWIGHNIAAFDSLFLAAAGVDVSKMQTIDTFINAAVLLSGVRFDTIGRAVSAGLQHELQRRLGVTLPEDKSAKQRQKWVDKPFLTADDLEYCVGDVVYLPALLRAQWEQASVRQRHALRLEREVASMLTQVSMHGLPVDRGAMERKEQEYRQAMEGPAARLQQLLPNCNPNYSVGVRQRINEKYGLELTSVNRDMRLTAMLEHHSWAEVAEALNEYQAARATAQLLASKHIAADGRIHGKYSGVGARSARMSSSGPNMQQFPRSCREIFVAPAGFLFVIADFEQIEVAVAAIVAADADLMEAVKTGDVYSGIAAKMFNLDMASLSPEEFAQYRATAKIIVLGSQYGGSPRVLQREFRKRGRAISYDEAKGYQDQLFGTFKGLDRMRRQAMERAKSAQRRNCPLALELASGMQRIYLPSEVRGPSLLATRVSSLAAIGLKLGLCLVKEAGLLPRVCACVHDELLLLVPEAEADVVKEQVKALMTEGMLRVVPEAHVSVDVKIQHTWSKSGDPEPDVSPDDDPERPSDPLEDDDDDDDPLHDLPVL